MLVVVVEDGGDVWAGDVELDMIPVSQANYNEPAWYMYVMLLLPAIYCLLAVVAVAKCK